MHKTAPLLGYWIHVLCSDETKINLFGSDGVFVGEQDVRNISKCINECFIVFEDVVQLHICYMKKSVHLGTAVFEEV